MPAHASLFFVNFKLLSYIILNDLSSGTKKYNQLQCCLTVISSQISFIIFWFVIHLMAHSNSFGDLYGHFSKSRYFLIVLFFFMSLYIIHVIFILSFCGKIIDFDLILLIISCTQISFFSSIFSCIYCSISSIIFHFVYCWCNFISLFVYLYHL